MAIFPFVDGHWIVNGVTLSDHANQINVVDERAEIDITTFGASNIVITKGLGSASIGGVMFQDFAAAKTHATCQPLLSSTTPIAVEVRPTSAARSATNPAALLSGALLMTYNFLQGSVGEASTTELLFKNAVSAGMTYPTS